MTEAVGQIDLPTWTKTVSSGKFSGQVDDSRTIPSVQTLSDELHRLVRMGLPKVIPEALPALFDLQLVKDEVRGERSEDLILALERALSLACCLLRAGRGTGSRRSDPSLVDVEARGPAAEALLGLHAATRWASRSARRRAAALTLLDPGYEVDTFRRKYESPLINDLAYALYKLERHVASGSPLDPEDVTSLNARGFELVTRVAPSSGMRLIRTNGDLMKSLHAIVREAREHLVTTGSRSRDPEYLTAIESALIENPGLVHYRVLFGPPHWQVLKDHLLRLIEIRSPASRPRGAGKTLHIGLFEDSLREPEAFICANERHAFVRLPSLTRMESYDTGVEMLAPVDVGGYLDFAVQLYEASRKIETRRAVVALPVLAESDDEEGSA